MENLEKSKQTLPAFDYSELEPDTTKKLQNLSSKAREVKQNFIWDMAEIVNSAHDLLANNKNGTFGAWCESELYISRRTANNLLDIAQLLHNSTEAEQAVLEQAPATLLYATAKPSAPPELVDAVKAGSITTNAEYQKVLKELENERAARKAAEKKVTGLQASYDTVHKNEEYTIERSKKLEQAKAEIEKQLEGARQAMQAAKMRGDKLKAENEDLRARPVEVAVDPDEVERRANAKAEKLTADLRRQLEETKKPPAAVDNGESEENRCYDQVIHANRLISSSWGLAKDFYRKLPSGGADSLKYIAAEMISRSLEQIKEDLKCL
jgi:chromosome segregation ATPase